MTARRFRALGARALLWLGAGAASALLLLLAGYICFRGLPGLSWAFLTGEDSLLHGTRGILPAVANTLAVIVLSLAAVVPLGVGAAVYLTEYAHSRLLVGTVEFAAGVLAGVPSILYAIAGALLFCGRLGLGKTLPAGAMTLAVMNLPTVLRSAQESLKAVPASYREGALGLGAGRWTAIRTLVLPASRDGLVSGCVLAAGRVIGETAVLLYTAGVSTAMQDFSHWPEALHASGATLSAALYVYAKERGDLASAFATAAVLLALAALIALAAALPGRRRGCG